MKSEANILSGSVFTEDMYEAAVKRAVEHHVKTLREGLSRSDDGSSQKGRKLGLSEKFTVFIPRRIRKFSDVTGRRLRVLLSRRMEKRIEATIRAMAKSRVGAIVEQVNGTYYPASDVLAWLGDGMLSVEGRKYTYRVGGAVAAYQNLESAQKDHINKASGFDVEEFKQILSGDWAYDPCNPESAAYKYSIYAEEYRMYRSNFNAKPSVKLNDYELFMALMRVKSGELTKYDTPQRAVMIAKRLAQELHRVGSSNKWGVKPFVEPDKFVDRLARPLREALKPPVVESSEPAQQEVSEPDAQVQAGVGLGIGLGIGILLVFGLLSVVAG